MASVLPETAFAFTIIGIVQDGCVETEPSTRFAESVPIPVVFPELKTVLSAPFASTEPIVVDQ